MPEPESVSAAAGEPADQPGDDAGPAMAERTDRPLPRSMWLLSENRRSTLSSLIGGVMAAPMIGVSIRSSAEIADIAGTGALLYGGVIVWTLMTATHLVLTVLAYRGLEGERFRDAVLADPGLRSRRHPRWRRWLRASFLADGPSSWSITMSMIALFVVVALNLQPELRAIPLVLTMGLALVALCWFSVAMTFAVHYARMDAQEPAFAFAGDQPDRFGDYLYLGIGVQVSFTSGDVQVLRSEVRHAISGHAVLAFTFNTVILGMIVSLLLRLT